jgi:hypothetical protein
MMSHFQTKYWRYQHDDRCPARCWHDRCKNYVSAGKRPLPKQGKPSRLGRPGDFMGDTGRFIVKMMAAVAFALGVGAGEAQPLKKVRNCGGDSFNYPTMFLARHPRLP